MYTYKVERQRLTITTTSQLQIVPPEQHMPVSHSRRR